jgi:hypothetical protein
MAEIGTLKDVWKKAKISLCWWHLRRAVRTRLAKNKLSTTPYDMKRACAEFNFIDPEFVPPRTRVDRDDYEGDIPDDKMIQPHSAEPASSAASKEMPFGNAMNTFRIKLPPKSQSASASLPKSAHHDGDKENMHGTPCGAKQPIRVKHVVLHVSLAPKSTLSEQLDGAKPADEISDDDENDGNPERRTFCPAAHRDAIINMIEQHYCAHPLIPGYAAPDPGAIKRWAVQKMYCFCEKHDLREVWAYLWENCVNGPLHVAWIEQESLIVHI